MGRESEAPKKILKSHEIIIMIVVTSHLNTQTMSIGMALLNGHQVAKEKDPSLLGKRRMTTEGESTDLTVRNHRASFRMSLQLVGHS